MQVYFNEKEIDITPQSNLFSMLEKNGFSTQKGIAVAVQNSVIPRSEWETYLLQENDRILVITATKGG